MYSPKIKPLGMIPQVVLGHPLARSCVSFWACHEGASIPRDCLGSKLRLPNAGSLGHWRRFRGSDLAAAANVGNAASTSEMQFTSGAFTVWCYFRQILAVPNSVYPSVFQKYNFVSAIDRQGWNLQMYPPDAGVNANKLLFFMSQNDALEFLVSTTSFTTVNVDYTIAGTSDGSSIARIYVNGIQEDTDNVRFNPSGQTLIGPILGSSTLFLVYAAATWARELSAAEILTLNTRPYEMLDWKERDSELDQRAVFFPGGNVPSTTQFNLRLMGVGS